MGKIVFVFPPLTPFEIWGNLAAGGGLEPPLGLAYLAAMTRKHGYETQIVDAAALKLNLKSAVQAVLSESPDYVGISAVTMAIFNAADLAHAIKKARPDVFIILGGAHITAAPEDTMNMFSGFDVGVIGEGEKTIVELLEALDSKNDLAKVDGLIVRTNNGPKRSNRRAFIRKLDELPMPAWDLFPDIGKHYSPPAHSLDRKMSTSIITSRGCSGKCIFCDRSIFGNFVRAHSPDYTANVVRHLYYTYGIRGLRFDDDNLMLFRKNLEAICHHIIREKLDVLWSCMARVDFVDPEILELMYQAGCRQIRYGIESGSPEVLKIIKKQIKLDQIKNAVKWTRRAGIRTMGYFMIGHPGETKDTIRQTIDFAKRIDLDEFKINFFTPLPGTEIYREAYRYGHLSTNLRDFHFHRTPSFIPFGLTEKDLIRDKKTAFREFYLRPRIILRHITRIRNLAQLMSLAKGTISLVWYWLKK
jgi:anaerobic magnesium-protoporphyrin IX monomethyl ester cyclase